MPPTDRPPEPLRVMPPKTELRFWLRTRQWPGSVRLLAFPVGFGLGPLFLSLRDEPLPGVAVLFAWLAGGLAVGSGALMLLLLWLRRGPDLGLGEAGVWLRPSPWRRGSVFVPYRRLRDLEVRPVNEWGAWFIGVEVRLRTDEGPVPRRPRFVPCRRDGYESLARVAASLGRLTGSGG